jgi:hypothetical protein
MPTVSETRKQLSDLVKGVSMINGDAGVNYNYASVDVKGSGDIENIGVPLIWSESDSAFVEFTPNADWTASAFVSVGDVVKPTTQNGYEYVCITAGTTGSSEPSFATVPGATTTDNTATWLCRNAYAGNGNDSPLPNKAVICVTCGSKEGAGVNSADTTLSSTATEMTVVFRGEAALAKSGFEWGSIATADQNEFYAQLEKQGIALVDSGTTVDPAFV